MIKSIKSTWNYLKSSKIFNYIIFKLLLIVFEFYLIYKICSRSPKRTMRISNSSIQSLICMLESDDSDILELAIELLKVTKISIMQYIKYFSLLKNSEIYFDKDEKKYLPKLKDDKEFMREIIDFAMDNNAT